MKNARKYLIISIIIISLGFILFNFKKEYLSEDDILGIYINNELSDNYPSKGSALFQKAVCDDASTKVTWDNDKWGLLIKNMTKKTRCNLYFYKGKTVFNYDYTGNLQTFMAQVSGTYKLETWGAQGGWAGGYGGYSIGTISLSVNDKLYIAVGGKGGDVGWESAASTIPKGGYNGGGNGGRGLNYSSGTYPTGGGGGGATSIQNILVKDGLLKRYSSAIDNILIVSGGGGGENVHTKLGGAGGGMNGTDSIAAPGYGSGTTGGKAKGATQTSGYAFGYGQSSADRARHGSYGAEGNGGGGGGFYGGYSNESLGANTNDSGGGGSGYIGNPLLTNKVMYCYNCEESSEESTKTISTTCSEETPTSNCAKKGNGYARITIVSIDE